VVEYHPINSVQNRAPIDFGIPRSGEQYIDPSNIQLLMNVKNVQPAGANIANDAMVAPVNFLHHIMFLQGDISLNGMLISNSTNAYLYWAVLETLLSYGGDAKTSQLS